jgi:GGDEF domain-containing protein
LDVASGLYHAEHFKLTVVYEMSRMERTEKPVGMVVVHLDKHTDEIFKALGAFLKSALRPLDLAAKLGGGQVAVLMPEADRDRGVQLVLALGREFENNRIFSDVCAKFGASIARPFDGTDAQELLRRSRDNPLPACLAAQKLLSGASPWAEVDTALAVGEKDSLFDGFSVLSGPASR